MRNQTKFTYQIGYAVQSKRFETDLAALASTHCGGCTTSTKTGWWCADGAEKGRDTFFAKPEQEHCFQLELTCEEHKADAVYDAMMRGIAHIVAVHGIETNWVHCSEVQMTGRHFSVEALNAPQAVSVS